jgi:hypothetical protein
MSTTAWFTTWAESHDSPHLTKTLIHRFITPRLSVATILQPPVVHLRRAHNRKTCCPFVSTDFHQANTDFGSTSHMPPTDLCFQTSPKPLLKHPTLGYLSSILETLPQFSLPQTFLRLVLSKSLAKFFYAFLWLCTLCSYRDSKGHLCETSCLLGVSCPFMNPHSNDLLHPSMDPVCPSKPCVPINHHVSWTVCPILGCTPLSLCSSLVSIIMTPCGCVDGVIQPLQCAHVVEGRWVHSLGMLPSFPTLSQMQPKSPSIILRKVRCVPPWCCMSPLCTQGAPAHTQMSLFSQPITSFLVLFLFSSPNLPKECACSVGVMGDLTSSPTPSCFILNNICRSPWCLYPISGSVTTQRLLSPQLLSSRKTLLRKFFKVCPSVGCS